MTPSTNEILIAGLLATARDLNTAGQALTGAGGRLEALAKALEAAEGTPEAEDSNPYKKPNGRLSDAGARAVEIALRTGEAVTEIAKRFDIHPSAVSSRKKLLDASKNFIPKEDGQ